MRDHDVLLRRFRVTDREDLVALANNPGVARFLADRFPHPYRREDAEAWIELTARETRPCNFAVEWNGALVGGAGLMPLSDIHAGTAEVGYWLGEPFWGKGLAARALKLLTRYAFEELLFIRLQANVFKDNAASMRVLEKNDYVREGVLRKHIRKNGAVTDAVLYAKLRNP